jgi:hypothetical protein
MALIKKKELAPGIFVYSDVIDGHETLVSDLEEGLASSRIGWSESYITIEGESKKDTEIRDTLSVIVPYEKSDTSTLYGYLNESVRTLLFKFFHPIEIDYKHFFHVHLDSHEPYQILKYGVGQKFTNHVDDGPGHNRKVSITYYLNDDYEGGEIVFPRFGISYKPRANEMLVFPSTFVYNHSVNPVISGTRYAVVTWLK